MRAITVRELISALEPYIEGAEPGAECTVSVDEERQCLRIDMGSDLNDIPVAVDTPEDVADWPASLMETQVRWFMSAMKQTIGARIGPPAIHDAELRARLILEEAVETVEAIVGTERAKRLIDGARDSLWRREFAPVAPNLVEAVDGICDLIFVALGSAIAFGVGPLTRYFNFVSDANMTKAHGPVDEHGKKLKPPGFIPPNEKIRALLVQRGWKP